MAKCPLCNIHKGKRKCLIANNQFICSLCCGSTRKASLCSACVFYLPPQHDYEKVPAFSVSALENNHALESYSQAISQACISVGDLEAQDEIAILELLLNKHYFHDEEIYSANVLHKDAFAAADKVMSDDLALVDKDVLINVLGAMRHAAKSKAGVV